MPSNDWISHDVSDITLFENHQRPNERGDGEKFRFSKEFLGKLSPIFKAGLDHFGYHETNMELGVDFEIETIKTIWYIMIGTPLKNCMMTPEVIYFNS